jgi:hypothetical protein
VALMSRLPSWLIVAAVGLLVSLAAADAIRPHAEAQKTPVTTSTPGPNLQGVLLLPGAGCDPVALRLPGALVEEPRRPADCGGFVWSPDGSLSARCRDGFTEVLTRSGVPVLRLRGCSPAWRQDGAVSVIRDGDLVVARRHGRPYVFVAKADLAKELERELGATYELSEIAWIDPATFSAILRGSEPRQHAVIVASRERIETFVPELGQRISSLRASPAGYVAFARNQLGREFVMLTRAGRSVLLPRIANAQAIAWSPDGQWLALATRTSTFIARIRTRGVVMRIPVGGESLEWLP